MTDRSTRGVTLPRTKGVTLPRLEAVAVAVRNLHTADSGTLARLIDLTGDEVVEMLAILERAGVIHHGLLTRAGEDYIRRSGEIGDDRELPRRAVRATGDHVPMQAVWWAYLVARIAAPHGAARLLGIDSVTETALARYLGLAGWPMGQIGGSP